MSGERWQAGRFGGLELQSPGLPMLAGLMAVDGSAAQAAGMTLAPPPNAGAARNLRPMHGAP